MKAKLQVLENDIATTTKERIEYICIYPAFKVIEFDDLKKQAGLNSFTKER